MDGKGGSRSGVDCLSLLLPLFTYCGYRLVGFAPLKHMYSTIQYRDFLFTVFVLGDCVYVYKIIKRPTNAFEYMNVNLLYSNHRHVSATHVAIFRVARTRIQRKLCVGINPQFKNLYNFG
jgi:hypothetical protein